jgi:DNA-binding MarR family transcriptional regulator
MSRTAARPRARDSAREILTIVPLVMRAVAAELRASGELPAPAHFGLLHVLSTQPTPVTLTELAALQGVSLPTISNSVSALVDRGWVRRIPAGADRRQVIAEVTASGRAALERVGRSAEAHLAVVLAPLDPGSRRRLQAGLTVLRRLFAAPSPGRRNGKRHGRTNGRA